MTSVDLPSLPDISFAPQDTSAVEADILTIYERIANVTLQPGDPVRLFLETLAYVISVQNGLIDLAGKQNLLAFASGAHLDHLGALMGVSRIPAQNALCLVRFAIAAPLDFAVPIPAGTRVTTQDAGFTFATVATRAIEPGSLSVDAAAVATVPGAEATGLVPGQINSLVDPIPYVVSVSNVTASSEGADIEDDERLRQRIRLAPESYTVAGSSGQYEARVLEVSSEIESVSVHSPEPGVVDIRFTLAGGELPDAAMIALVREALNAETVRPLTDMVLAGAPEPVPYTIRGTWFLGRSNAALLGAVTQNVTRALEAFRLWQRSRPGRDINPSRLISLVEQAGVKRVELEEPAFTRLTGIQIAREQEIALAFGGLEED